MSGEMNNGNINLIGEARGARNHQLLSELPQLHITASALPSTLAKLSFGQRPGSSYEDCIDVSSSSPEREPIFGTETTCKEADASNTAHISNLKIEPTPRKGSTDPRFQTIVIDRPPEAKELPVFRGGGAYGGGRWFWIHQLTGERLALAPPQERRPRKPKPRRKDSEKKRRRRPTQRAPYRPQGQKYYSNAPLNSPHSKNDSQSPEPETEHEHESEQIVNPNSNNAAINTPFQQKFGGQRPVDWQGDDQTKLTQRENKLMEKDLMKSIEEWNEWPYSSSDAEPDELDEIDLEHEADIQKAIRRRKLEAASNTEKASLRWALGM